MAQDRRESFQSTRPVRGETADEWRALTMSFISIHSPRAGRDSPESTCRRWRQNFNPLAPCGARRGHLCDYQEKTMISIHSPRAGRDLPALLPTPCAPVFQSTRPVRGETRQDRSRGGDLHDFNPLAPCGARRVHSKIYLQAKRFQSTRPVRGETARSAAPRKVDGDFNPLAPCGARHRLPGVRVSSAEISIHSPRAGRDYHK